MSLGKFAGSLTPCGKLRSSLREAKKAYDALPFKHGYRIAEVYTQVRYKAVRI